MSSDNPAQIVRNRFKGFQRAMEDIWKEYAFLGFYLPRVGEKVKAGDMPAFTLDSFKNPGSTHMHSKKNTFGYISHILDTGRGRATLIQSVAAFEHYNSNLSAFVYSKYPGKLAGVEADESAAKQTKLLALIIGSADKQEIVDKLIEERVRSIFYGNPVDFFLKDKARLEFGDAFKDKCPGAMDLLAEVIARRNIYTHNDRRVDRKYIREVKGTPLKLGNVARVDDNYLGKSINLMIGIAAMSSCLVIEHVFKESPSHGYVGWAYLQFQRTWWKQRTAGKANPEKRKS